MLINFHAAAGFVFSTFVLLHIGHHLLGAVYGSDAHRMFQRDFFGRDESRSNPLNLAVEFLFIGLPAATTAISGFLLLRKQSISQIAKSFLINPFPATDTAARVAIRQLQIASSAVFGAFLFTHSSAVMFLRFVATCGIPLNYEGASHGLHHLGEEGGPLVRSIGTTCFAMYYCAFIVAFFVHAASGYAARQLREAGVGGGASGSNIWWYRVVQLVFVLACPLAIFIVSRMIENTTPESVKAHWPL